MRFNFFSKSAKTETNYEGAKAYRQTPEWELYAAVVTASLSDQFYEKAIERLVRIRTLIGQNKPEYVAKLAVYTRTSMHLRSIPLVLLVESARQLSGDDVLKNAVNAVVQRADEITELLAYYQMANKRKGIKKLNRLSKQLQKGLAMSFNKFDEYQFAKYDRATEIKLRDALFLVHPKAKDETQQALFDKIAAQTLETPYTWETELSALGQQSFANENEKAVAFRQKWEELIGSGKLGYMALLRNLRNILEANVSAEALEKVARQLSDEKAVMNSKQLPFRFLAAYRELKDLQYSGVARLVEALEKAVSYSANNLRGFNSDARVLIACDVSGSMQTPISQKSKIMHYDIGLMLGMLLQSRCKRVESGIFGDTWKIVSMPNKGILANVNAFYRREGEVGYSTNGYLVVQDLVNRRVVVDKVMMFTDCQLWNSTTDNNYLTKAWDAYKQIAPNAKLYLFDLNGYGRMPISYLRDDVCMIAGWSDKVFEVLEAIENGGDALSKINEIKL
jgi:60 kDa SS-A/Ro ribonucleoprotein